MVYGGWRRVLAGAVGTAIAVSPLLVGAPAAAGDIGPLVTVAGGGDEAVADGELATSGDVGLPSGLALDGDGGFYVGEFAGRVRRVDPAGIITTVAGNGQKETSGDGGPATAAGLERVTGLATGPAGELYIADGAARRVRLVATDGTITTVAGTGEEGTAGDHGPATQAQLRYPEDVAVGPDGELYIADGAANQVRMVATDGTITTVAGTGEEGTAGDHGPATQAQLRSPQDVTVGPDGELYIADSPERRPGSAVMVDGARIRAVDPAGDIRTVASGGDCADRDGDATPSLLCATVRDLAVDADGVLYLPDLTADAVWAVPPGGEATRLPVYVSGAYSVAVSAAGELYVGRGIGRDRHVVQRVSLTATEPPAATPGERSAWDDHSAGTLALAAGTGQSGFAGDAGPARQAQLSQPTSLAAGPDGTVYVADVLNRRVRAIGADGTIDTVAGNGGQFDELPKDEAGPAPGDGELASEVPLRNPVGVAAGPDGSVYICDERDNRVYRVSPTGVITTFAGTGEEAFAGDGGPAVDAALTWPADVAVGPDGSVYIVDAGNQRIRKVDPDGTITTAASLRNPLAVAVAPDGTVYTVKGSQVWTVGRSGVLTAVTADPNTADAVDDLDGGAPARNLEIFPADVAVGPDGTLYVATGARVLAVDSDGVATVAAGTGRVGDRAGDSDAPEETDLPPVDAITVDHAGNLYISHPGTHQVTVMIAPTTGSTFPWHWLALALAAASAAVTVWLAIRARRS